MGASKQKGLLHGHLRNTNLCRQATHNKPGLQRCQAHLQATTKNYFARARPDTGCLVCTIPCSGRYPASMQSETLQKRLASLLASASLSCLPGPSLRRLKFENGQPPSNSCWIWELPADMTNEADSLESKGRGYIDDLLWLSRKTLPPVLGSVL